MSAIWTNINKNSDSSTYSKNSIILFGDSLTCNTNSNNGLSGVGNITYQNKLLDTGSFTYFNLALGSPFRVLRNSGISGDKTTDLLARIDTDVIAYNPKYCFVMIGVNDISISVAKETIVANIIKIYTKLKYYGIKILASTITPVNSFESDAIKYSALSYINSALLTYAQNNDGIIVLDGFSAVNNPATKCSWVGAIGINTIDGIHYSAMGSAKIGKYWALQFGNLLPKFSISTSAADIASSNNVNGNIILNPILDGTTGLLSGTAVTPTGQAPTNWWFQMIGDMAGNITAVSSRVIRTDKTFKSWWQVALTWTSAQTAQATFQFKNYNPSYVPLPANVTTGDILETALELNITSVNASGIQVIMEILDASNVSLTVSQLYYSSLSALLPDFSGILILPDVVIPNNAAEIRFSAGIKNISSTNGNAIMQLGDIIVRKKIIF